MVLVSTNLDQVGHKIQMLQKYGITYINDFFYGENLFNLLSDFQKPEWRNQYLNAKE